MACPLLSQILTVRPQLLNFFLDRRKTALFSFVFYFSWNMRKQWTNVSSDSYLTLFNNSSRSSRNKSSLKGKKKTIGKKKGKKSLSTSLTVLESLSISLFNWGTCSLISVGNLWMRVQLRIYPLSYNWKFSQNCTSL